MSEPVMHEYNHEVERIAEITEEYEALYVEIKDILLNVVEGKISIADAKIYIECNGLERGYNK